MWHCARCCLSEMTPGRLGMISLYLYAFNRYLGHLTPPGPEYPAQLPRSGGFTTASESDSPPVPRSVRLISPPRPLSALPADRSYQ
jgi:hypothetical protein